MSRVMLTYLFAVLSLLVIGGCDAPVPTPSQPPTAAPSNAPPKQKDRMDFHLAVGEVDEIPKRIRPIFASENFQLKRDPGSSDWLAAHPEPGESFEEFKRSNPNRPDGVRNTIYFQPLGSFEGSSAPALENLEMFGEAFFQMPVVILDPIDISNAGITERRNPNEGQRQLLTRDILDLLKQRLPDDAFCQIGITMLDLYPDPSWNFVFGQASLRDRVGIFSFARYEADDPQLTLRRSMKVMAHETGHMFGIRHCIYFECLMNGSNHLQESDTQPMFLGPVDLRKLTWSVGFDPVKRYGQLAEVYRKLGFEADARRARELADLGTP